MAIYDCFTFFNELDLLELRLELLNPVVDYFVLVEIDKTQCGEHKKRYFRENRDRYDRYKEKIIYIETNEDEIPEYSRDNGWAIENWQRNCIIRGLTRCKPNDLIMISDLDEMIHPRVLRNLDKEETVPDLRRCGIRKICLSLGNQERVNMLTPLRRSILMDVLEITPVACEQNLYRYYLNYEAESKWRGTVISLYRNMMMPQKIRDLRERVPVIKNAGWHFSYMGGIDSIKMKLDSITDGDLRVHQKLKHLATDDDYINGCISEGKDLFGDFALHYVDDAEIGLENEGINMSKYRDYLFRDK